MIIDKKIERIEQSQCKDRSDEAYGGNSESSDTVKAVLDPV